MTARRLLCLLAACGAVACASPPWEAAAWGSAPEARAADAAPALAFQPPSDLPAPRGLVATSGLYRRVVLQWEPLLLAGVGGYLVESADAPDGEFAQRAALRDRGTLAWTDDGADAPLGDGRTRHYRLRAFDRGGLVSGAASAAVAATTAPLPAPPEGLHAYSRQPRSIPLVWQASDDALVAGYRVERSPAPDGPFEVVAEVDGRHTTHVLDGGLGNLRVLHYRVSALNEGGEAGPPGAVVRAVTKPAPLPPIGLALSGRRLGVAVLEWEPNVEADLESYRLLRTREGAQEPETVGYVGETHTRIEDAGVGAGERVTYSLVAVDRDGLESRPSGALAVEGLSYELAATASAGGVRLRWNRRESEGYVRARITRASWPWRSRVAWSDDGEWLDEDVSPGRSYVYVIELERADGSFAPPSRPLEVAVPDAGDGFVEIQPPASRIPPPEGVPR